jgi:two-component system, OmpR family, response regulator
MKAKKTKILLCEDDINLGTVLKSYLELEDYEVVLERDGRLGFAAFQMGGIDLCLLDVMMPFVDGFTLAENIRDLDPDVPLFFLSAKTMKEDIIQGYKLGADDYITKPFDSELLLLKIKAIIKRSEDQNFIADNIEFEIGNYLFIPRTRELFYKKVTTILTPKETELLRILIENKNEVVARDKALKKVWGSSTYFNGRSMDVYIGKIRKLFINDQRIELLNVHGSGYRLVAP